MITTITLTKEELMSMLTQAAKVAVAEYMALQDPRTDLVSQRIAYSMYGRERVSYWIERGLVTNRGRTGDGRNSKILFSKMELQNAEYADRVKGAGFFAR